MKAIGEKLRKVLRLSVADHDWLRSARHAGTKQATEPAPKVETCFFGGTRLREEPKPGRRALLLQVWSLIGSPFAREAEGRWPPGAGAFAGARGRVTGGTEQEHPHGMSAHEGEEPLSIMWNGDHSSVGTKDLTPCSHQWLTNNITLRMEVRTMAAVGIRELKNKLSDYITRAKAGERIEITNRGWVVALLVPATELAEVVQSSEASGTAKGDSDESSEEEAEY